MDADPRASRFNITAGIHPRKSASSAVHRSRVGPFDNTVSLLAKQMRNIFLCPLSVGRQMNLAQSLILLLCPMPFGQESSEKEPHQTHFETEEPFAWHVLSHCLPANGPICRWKRWPVRRSEFGYDGLELACWGDHFEVDKALSDSSYCKRKRELLEKNDLQVFAISNHLVGQAVCDNIDERHKSILPAHVWGDGKPEGVNQRAAEEMKNTARAAQKFGVSVVNGFTGSSIWHMFYAFPPMPGKMIDDGFKQFAERWNPILDVFGECGVKFALEVHPDGNRVRYLFRPAGDRSNRRPRGVRLQLRSQPLPSGRGRPGGIHPRVSRSHLSRAREGRDRRSERPQRAFSAAI